MSRPTFGEFAARWWEFRPTSVGVVVMTLATVLVRAVTDWPLWVCLLGIATITAGLCALAASLEIWGEEPGVDAKPEADEP